MRQEFPQQSTAQASHAIASQQIGYVQHLRWRFPRWSQLDEPSTLAHEHLRKTVSLPRMRQNIRLAKLTANPYAYSYRWVYFGVVKWGEIFHIELRIDKIAMILIQGNDLTDAGFAGRLLLMAELYANMNGFTRVSIPFSFIPFYICLSGNQKKPQYISFQKNNRRKAICLPGMSSGIQPTRCSAWAYPLSSFQRGYHKRK